LKVIGNERNAGNLLHMQRENGKMQVMDRPEIRMDLDIIYEMRLLGAPMQQIADRIGKSKERIRQILVSQYGTTKHKLMSTTKLAKNLDLPRSKILELYQKDVIAPALDWYAGSRHYILWSTYTEDRINDFLKQNRFCKICGTRVPKGKLMYCSDECLKESRKYRYKSPEGKRKLLIKVKRYRERKKRLAQIETSMNDEGSSLIINTVDRKEYAAVSTR